MTIRTPDDEVTKPGWFLPPFAPGKGYQGTTYPGHSDFSVDWNRRTPTGGWLDDTGDPVLAAADGTVAEVDPREGLVMLSHPGGYQTEYRHMTGIPVKVGDKVKRGDQVGRIGNVAGDGRSFGAHLHHVHWRNGKRIQMRFEGKPVATSVGDSDTRPSAWKPPAPVYVIGPPPRATWEDAYRQAQKALDKAEAKVDSLTIANGALTEERDAARQDLALAKAEGYVLSTSLVAARTRITELENATAPDCSGPIQTAIAAEHDRLVALVEGGVADLVARIR